MQQNSKHIPKSSRGRLQKAIIANSDEIREEHIIFAELIALGKSQSEAYDACFPNEDRKKSGSKMQGFKLANVPVIKELIAQKQKELQEKQRIALDEARQGIREKMTNTMEDAAIMRDMRAKVILELQEIAFNSASNNSESYMKMKALEALLRETRVNGKSMEDTATRATLLDKLREKRHKYDDTRH